jgi:hypothetical protein
LEHIDCSDGTTLDNAPCEFAPFLYISFGSRSLKTLLAVFISPTPDLPGADALVPRPLIALWFQKDLKAGTMIELDITLACLVDFSAAAERSVTFTDELEWVIGHSVDYTRVVAARTK